MKKRKFVGSVEIKDPSEAFKKIMDDARKSLPYMHEYAILGFIGELTKHRKQLGISETELAKRMGITKKELVKILSGEEDTTFFKMIRFGFVMGMRITPTFEFSPIS